MRTKWVGKRVDLSMVLGLVEEFFAGKGLRTKEYSVKSGCRVVAFAENLASAPLAAVEVHSDFDDLVIDYLPWGKRERVANTSLLGSVLPLLGAGVFVYQDLKKREAVEKIENEFWDFLETRFSELG
jgi:hypothetical protein